jgi:hypothetical protein
VGTRGSRVDRTSLRATSAFERHRDVFHPRRNKPRNQIALAGVPGHRTRLFIEIRPTRCSRQSITISRRANPRMTVRGCSTPSGASGICRCATNGAAGPAASARSCLDRLDCVQPEPRGELNQFGLYRPRHGACEPDVLVDRIDAQHGGLAVRCGRQPSPPAGPHGGSGVRSSPGGD